jgi:polysaccharide biosynthesis transport protein
VQLQDYLRLVRRHWLLILVTTLLGLVVSLAYVLLAPAQYQSTAKALISASTAKTVNDLSQGATYTQSVVKTYADIATTGYVLRPVIQELRLRETSQELAKRVEVTAPADETILEITATDRSPSGAAALANAVASELRAAVANITPSSTSADANFRVVQVEQAAVPVAPASPNVALSLILGVLIGLVLGVLTALLRSTLDTRVRAAHDVEHITERPVLGSMTYDPRVKSSPLVVRESAGSPRAEEFRTLRTNLQFVEIPRGSRAIVVTSSVEGEGKSTIAANLALIMADAGERVALVDADLRRPRLAEYLGMDAGVGMTDVLIEAVPLDDALQQFGDGTLFVLPAGRAAPNPGELVQGERMTQLIEELRGRFDAVIFDAPPLLPVSDARVLAHHTDGALVVASVRKVRRAQLRSALVSLARADARVLGVVMTLVPKRGPDAYGYGYGDYGAAAAVSA